MTEIRLVTCVGVEWDLDLLPHFLAHYVRLGVRPDAIHSIIHAPHADHPGIAGAEKILGSVGSRAERIWTAPYTSRAMWQERRDLQAAVAHPDDIVVSADVDEFHEYPAPLEDIVAWCRKNRYHVVQGPFIDRLAADGRLRPVPPPEDDLAAVFPLQTELRHHLAGISENVNLGGSVKAMLLKGDVMPGTGGHGTVPEQRDRPHALGTHLSHLPDLNDPHVRFGLPFLVHHYKWTDGLALRMRRRLETPGITPAGQAYAEALLAFFEKCESVPLDALALRNPARHGAGAWTARVNRTRRGVLARRILGLPRRVKEKLRSRAGTAAARP